MSRLPYEPNDAEFSLFVNENRRSLRAFILTIVQDYHLAEDILQESLAVVARTHEKEEIHHLRAYAREVARRQALKMIRSRSTDPIPLSDEALDSLQEAFQFLDGSVDNARIVALQGCMKKLPKNWRKILNLRYWDSKKITEIADRLMTHQNVVSVTINRAKSKLADCVASRIRVEEAKS